MKYLKVKSEYDGKNTYKVDASGRFIPTGWTLIANELLTEKEAAKMRVPEKCVIPVMVKKTETLFFFGARFEIGGFGE